MRANRIDPPWTYNDPRVLRRGCPSCGSTWVARVMSGMIFMTPELERLFDAKLIQARGCSIGIDYNDPGSVDRYCNACGTEWGLQAAPRCQWPKEPA